MSNKNEGFTLVEILVALTILAITMGAYLSQLDTQISQTHTIRNRTLAHWAGQNHLANMRLKNQWPKTGDQSFSSVQGQQEWLIQQNVSTTANAQIKRVQLRMFAADGEFSGSLVGYVNND
ncbi:type II secretion system minor pseudopilin GspI [Oceanospirillaceae bacterium]|jgi:general secretion pathway protein I|nr:type II secretion system minor pseudopilin GspI [Oceanospirillaceae bacterium]|tara:strand:- start:1965 stop:2327 length:363 start_codon:yes stop_codon:yes gene_type:complete